MKETMAELENFDHTLVIMKQRENQRIKRDLKLCEEELNSTSPPPTPSIGIIYGFHYYLAKAKTFKY